MRRAGRLGGQKRARPTCQSGDRASVFKNGGISAPFVDAESSLLRPNLITGCECFPKFTSLLFTETWSCHAGDFTNLVVPHFTSIPKARRFHPWANCWPTSLTSLGGKSHIAICGLYAGWYVEGIKLVFLHVWRAIINENKMAGSLPCVISSVPRATQEIPEDFKAL